jgi:prefoldin subunit 5
MEDMDNEIDDDLFPPHASTREGAGTGSVLLTAESARQVALSNRLNMPSEHFFEIIKRIPSRTVEEKIRKRKLLVLFQTSKKEAETLRAEVEAARGQVSALTADLSMVQQPKSYLIAKLRDEEEARKLAVVRRHSTEEELREKEREVKEREGDVAGLKERLAVLLDSRAELQSLRTLLSNMDGGEGGEREEEEDEREGSGYSEDEESSEEESDSGADVRERRAAKGRRARGRGRGGARSGDSPSHAGVDEEKQSDSQGDRERKEEEDTEAKAFDVSDALSELEAKREQDIVRAGERMGESEGERKESPVTKSFGCQTSEEGTHTNTSSGGGGGGRDGSPHSSGRDYDSRPQPQSCSPPSSSSSQCEPAMRPTPLSVSLEGVSPSLLSALLSPPRSRGPPSSSSTGTRDSKRDRDRDREGSASGGRDGDPYKSSPSPPHTTSSSPPAWHTRELL